MKLLTKDEIAEYEAFREAGLRPPDKYDDLVFEATSITGAVYRWKTDAEKKAEQDAAKAAAEAAAAREKLIAKVRGRSDAAAPATTRTPVNDANEPPAATGRARG